MKRTKHTLSHYRMMTAKMGEVLPIALQECLPGDTWQISSDILLRLKPLNTPVMHPTQLRVHHFFVPYRLLWSGWEDFITGESVSPIPTMATGASIDIRHYLGAIRSMGSVNGLPRIAYNKIINEYYLDQDLQTARTDTDNSIALCAWEKDYLSVARPWTQKGTPVTIPIGDTAPVVSAGDGIPSFDGGGMTDTDLRMSNTNTQAYWESSATSSDSAQWNTTALEADLSAATGADINDVRQAFALQRYQEARARYGSRYTEYLRYLVPGLTPSDARLQRPELLGGGYSPINYTEVLQTAPNFSGSGPSVGDLYGHGIAGFKGNRTRRFIEEHGYIMSLASVRPKAIYMDGAPRHLLKTTKEDFFQKEFEFVGQQAVLQNEVYADQGQETEVFGYSDRYDEYRRGVSQVFGDFRSTLDTWHMARKLPSDVTLNSDFVSCNPDDRIFQVQGESPLLMFVNNHHVARRIVGKNRTPRLL